MVVVAIQLLFFRVALCVYSRKRKGKLGERFGIRFQPKTSVRQSIRQRARTCFIQIMSCLPTHTHRWFPAHSSSSGGYLSFQRRHTVLGNVPSGTQYDCLYISALSVWLLLAICQKGILSNASFVSSTVDVVPCGWTNKTISVIRRMLNVLGCRLFLSDKKLCAGSP